MKTFKHHLKVRWSDLDANVHVANSAYMQFTSFARIETLEEIGITMKLLHKNKIGPVIFEENFYFFREILPNSEVEIHTRCTAMSENMVLFKFEHDIYDSHGEHKAKSTLFGCWLDLVQRRMMTELPPEMREILSQFNSDEIEKLSKENLREIPFRPQNLK